MSPLISILLLLLVAVPNSGDAGNHYPGASQVAVWNFEATRDEEIYAWPPGWTRRHGPGFPRYVQIRVGDDRPPPGGRCLCVDLNGGAASAFGPSIAIESGVDYVLEGFIKTSQLQHDAASLSLTLLDSARQKVDGRESTAIGGTSDWQKVCIGPLAPSAGAVTLVVGIHVGPRGLAEDLHGAAAFGGLWLGRVPRVVLTARQIKDKGDVASRGSPHGTDDSSFHVFPRGRPVEIACLVTGFSAHSLGPKYEVRLTLNDARGRTLDKHSETFSTALVPNTPSATNTSRAAAAIESRSGNSARATWQISSESVGYYRIRAQVVPLSLRERADKIAHEGEAYSFAAGASSGLAIIDPEAPPVGSEFGWSLDPHDAALGLVPLGDLLCQAGIRSVKFPFACSFTEEPATAVNLHGKSPGATSAVKSEPDRIEPLISFSDRLANSGVRLVGELLPPPAANGAGQAKRDLLAVEAFARDTKTWFPSIEPVLARLATEIRFWQIGDDRDPGWLDCTDLPAVVARVKTALDQIGQDLDVGIAWNLAAPLPVPAGKEGGTLRVPSAKRTRSTTRQKTPWSFLMLPFDATMSDTDLTARLDAAKSDGVQRWLLIDALRETGHCRDERIAQLVGRLIAAKIHGAEGIFFAHPFDPQRGLVGRDGSPNELYLPWRTTALTLGGAPYAGDIDLAGGSCIHCFGSHGAYVGVLVGDVPQNEAVFLGNRLRTRDVWGRELDRPPTVDVTAESAVTSPTPRSLLAVQRLPVFLTGLDGPVTEWQLNASFVPRSLPSIPLSEATIALEMKNTLPQSVTGRVRIIPPRNWYIQPESAEFRVEPGAVWKLPLKVALPNDVLAGRQMVAVEFEIQSDRFDHFTMYRPIEVTLGNVAILARAAVTERGDLEVRQTLSNQGKRPVGFRCILMAPDRRRQSTEIFLQPDAKSDFAYRLPNGRELLGKPLWLRAEEIGGPRVLNYRLDAPAGK